ncbi:MAG: nucleotide exchange factor GrpE [Salinivirgaceae bacterium]
MMNKDKNTQAVNEDELKNQADIKEKSQPENKSETQPESADNVKNESDSKNKSGKKKKTSKNSALEKVEKELEETRYKLSDINDRYIRLSAEFDNYRKRTLKEKADMIKTASGESLSDLIPVIDDFERALSVIDKAVDVNAVKEGLVLIYNKFKEFLKVKGITEIEALNQDFDTDFHEALTKIPAPSEEQKGKVVDVIQKGYKIEEKVIRYAKVVIGE